MSYFKSALDRRLLDSLWNKYWVNTLSSSSLLTNADYTTCQIFDLSEKLEQSEAAIGKSNLYVVCYEFIVGIGASTFFFGSDARN